MTDLSSAAPAVVVSPDRTQVAIYLPDGRKVSYEAMPGQHFDDTTLELAFRNAVRASLRLQGQRNIARRIRFHQFEVFTHVNTGPPTWWLPKLQLARTLDEPGVTLLTGWLRAAVAVTIQRAPVDSRRDTVLRCSVRSQQNDRQ